MKGLIGKKIFVNQLFTASGDVIPVTIIEAQPNIVAQVKTTENDGYPALQLAGGFKKNKNLSKSVINHLSKAKTEDKRVLSEFIGMEGYKLGDSVTIDLFKDGEFVNIQSVSKGKGTSGVVKRHNFARGPMTHGSKHHRAPGSVGLSRPDKVWKGQPLPGRKGNAKTTIKNLLIVKTDPKLNLLFVKGTFAGCLNSYCKIIASPQKKAVKAPELFVYKPEALTVETTKSLNKKKSTVDADKKQTQKNLKVKKSK